MLWEFLGGRVLKLGTKYNMYVRKCIFWGKSVLSPDSQRRLRPQKCFIYLVEREREWGKGKGQREKERESQATSTLSAEPDTGLNPTILRSQPEPKSRVGCSTNWATQAPRRQKCFKRQLISLSLPPPPTPTTAHFGSLGLKWKNPNDLCLYIQRSSHDMENLLSPFYGWGNWGSEILLGTGCLGGSVG